PREIAADKVVPGAVIPDGRRAGIESTRNIMRVSARTLPIVAAAMAIGLLLQPPAPSRAAEPADIGGLTAKNRATLLPPQIPSQQVRIETDTNRPGGDYKDYDIREGGAEVCQADCARDASCGSFTFVKPGIRGRFGHCFLKRGTPKPVADRCCISGVKATR